MSYISTIPPAEATGKLKEVYESGGGPSAARGKVAMVRQVQSLHPDAPRLERSGRRDHARPVESHAVPARNDRDRRVGDESL